MENAIEIKNLSKNFLTSRFPWQKRKVTPAICNVNLDIKENESFALLGPNGAGKTTLIKILCSLILADEGNIKVAGCDLGKQEELAKSRIGLITGDERSFYWRLTGRQNLDFFGTIYEVPKRKLNSRIEELAAMLNIDELDKRFDSYSAGIKQRFSIVRALLKEPIVLFADEPTKSLDPTSAVNLMNFLCKKLTKEKSITVFFATHRLEEAERYAERIAIMHKGEIKSCGTKEEIKANLNMPQEGLEKIYQRLTA